MMQLVMMFHRVRHLRIYSNVGGADGLSTKDDALNAVIGTAWICPMAARAGDEKGSYEPSRSRAIERGRCCRLKRKCRNLIMAQHGNEALKFDSELRSACS